VKKEGVPKKTYLALVYGSGQKRKLQVNAPLLKK